MPPKPAMPAMPLPSPMPRLSRRQAIALLACSAAPLHAQTAADDALAAAVWAYTVRSLSGTVNADVRYVNGVAITGTGVDGDTWGLA